MPALKSGRKRRSALNTGRKTLGDDERLRAQIERLARSEERAFAPRRGRFDFYHYLEAVLKVYWSWKDDGVRKTRRARVRKLYRIPARKGRKTLHVLIEATSQQESQTKNRWVQALQFAAEHRARIEKKGFKAFCQANGGIAGCARAARKKSLKTAGGLFPSAPASNLQPPARAGAGLSRFAQAQMARGALTSNALYAHGVGMAGRCRVISPILRGCCRGHTA